MDLPGYGYAEVPKNERRDWGPMIEGYLMGRPTLRMIFTLIDAQVGPTKLDIQMHEWLVSLGLPWKIVATKADQVKSSQTTKQRKNLLQVFGLDQKDVAWVSAREGTGMPALKLEVARFLTSSPA